MKECTIPGCSLPRESRGLCYGHYDRLRHRGDPLADIPLRHKRPSGQSPEEAFRYFMPGEPPESGCWEWTGTLRSGYGAIHYSSSKSPSAHRVSYEIHVGEIPDGLVVRHSCDNPPCVNPGHLLLGTQADNVQDTKDRQRTTKGHIRPRGEDCPNTKISDLAVAEMRRLYAIGDVTHKTLAGQFGIHQSSVQRVLRHR